MALTPPVTLEHYATLSSKRAGTDLTNRTCNRLKFGVIDVKGSLLDALMRLRVHAIPRCNDGLRRYRIQQTSHCPESIDDRLQIRSIRYGQLLRGQYVEGR